MTRLPAPNPAHVNTRPTTEWVSILLGRGHAVRIGSRYPGRLWVQPVTDQTNVDLFELGERVCAFLPFAANDGRQTW